MGGASFTRTNLLLDVGKCNDFVRPSGRAVTLKQLDV